MTIIDDQLFQVSCGKCGHQYSKSVGDVKRDGHFTCPACSDQSELDEAGREQIAAAEKQMLGIKESFEAAGRDLFKGGK